jgi:hypothetical protein
MRSSSPARRSAHSLISMAWFDGFGSQPRRLGIHACRLGQVDDGFDLVHLAQLGKRAGGLLQARQCARTGERCDRLSAGAE